MNDNFFLEGSEFEDFRDFVQALRGKMKELDNSSDEYDRSWVVANAKDEIKKRRRQILQTDPASQERLFHKCRELEQQLESWEAKSSLSDKQYGQILAGLIKQGQKDQTGDLLFTNACAGDSLQQEYPHLFKQGSDPGEQFRKRAADGKKLLEQMTSPPEVLQKQAERVIHTLTHTK